MNVIKLAVAFLLFGMLSCQHQSDHLPTSSEADSAEKNTTESTSEEEKTNPTPIFHASHEASRQNKPFSDVVQVGNTYYLTGQIGLDHTTGLLVDGGIEAETRQTLENIKAVLDHHGLSMHQVVKATVSLDTITDFAAFNGIYVTYFPQKPARTTVAVEALARGAKIEVEVIAVGNNL